MTSPATAIDIDTQPAKQPGQYRWLCCARPMHHHIPTHQIIVCGGCSCVKLGEKVFTQAQWVKLVEGVQ